MKELKGFNIVAPGSWNKKIFSPQWIVRDVMDGGPEDKIEGVFNSDEMELSYKIRDMVIAPKDNSLEITSLVNTHEAISSVFSTFMKIISLLPYTPVKGVGFNFMYAIDSGDVPFLKDQIQNLDLLPNDLEVLRLSYKKKLDFCTLNIIAEKRGNNWLITFNFHHPIVAKFDENHLEKLKSHINTYF